MRKSDAPLNVKYSQTMVECLCMLGKVAAAGAMIWYVVRLSPFFDYGSHISRRTSRVELRQIFDSNFYFVSLVMEVCTHVENKSPTLNHPKQIEVKSNGSLIN